MTGGSGRQCWGQRRGQRLQRHHRVAGLFLRSPGISVNRMSLLSSKRRIFRDTSGALRSSSARAHTVWLVGALAAEFCIVLLTVTLHAKSATQGLLKMSVTFFCLCPGYCHLRRQYPALFAQAQSPSDCIRAAYTYERLRDTGHFLRRAFAHRERVLSTMHTSATIPPQ